MNATKKKAPLPVPEDWSGPAIKAVLKAELERQKLTHPLLQRQLAEKGIDVPYVTLWEAVSTTGARAHLCPKPNVIAAVLAGLGRNWAWLERQLAG